MGMAMALAVAGDDEGPTDGLAAETSRPWMRRSRFRKASGAQGKAGQESDAARVAAQFCHPVARARDGHSDGAGVARSQRRGDDADLHACHAKARTWSEKPAGWLNAEGGARSLKRCSVK